MTAMTAACTAGPIFTNWVRKWTASGRTIRGRVGYNPLAVWERKKNHWVSGAIATLNPLIFQVRGEWIEERTPHLAKSKHLAPHALRQVQDFASSPTRGEEGRAPALRTPQGERKIRLS